MLLGYRSQSPPNQTRSRDFRYRPNDRDLDYTSGNRREMPIEDVRTDSRRDDIIRRHPSDAPRQRVDLNEPMREVEPPARRLRDYGSDTKATLPMDVKRRRLDERTADSAIARRNRSPSPAGSRAHLAPLRPHPTDRSDQSHAREDDSGSTYHLHLVLLC